MHCFNYEFALLFLQGMLGHIFGQQSKYKIRYYKQIFIWYFFIGYALLHTPPILNYPICLVLVISIIIRQRLWLASATAAAALAASARHLPPICLLAILQYDIYSYFLLILYSICALLLLLCAALTPLLANRI